MEKTQEGGVKRVKRLPEAHLGRYRSIRNFFARHSRETGKGKRFPKKCDKRGKISLVEETHRGVRPPRKGKRERKTRLLTDRINIPAGRERRFVYVQTVKEGGV